MPNPTHCKATGSIKSIASVTSDLRSARFVLYARKSTDREDRQVQSIPDQLALAEREAKRSSLTLVQTIGEKRSAKRHGNRPGFQEMVDLVEKGEIDGILCWHPDRLARNAIDGGWIIDLLDRGKLKHLQFLNFHFENTAEGKMMLGMVFSQAKYQVDKLAGDVTRGMASRREKGGFPHRAPEGYINVRDDRGDKVVGADPERFPKLKRALGLILNDNVVPAEAHRLLNDAWGYRTRAWERKPSGPLMRSTFYRLLQNPFIYGMCKFGESYYEGTQPPLVTKAEFDRLQAITRRPDKPRPSKNRFAYTGGLIRCGRCGCGITASLAKGHVYYHCTNMKGVCDRTGIREEAIDAFASALFTDIEITPEVERVLCDLVDETVRRLFAGKEADKEDGEKRLIDLQRRKDRLTDLLVDGVLSHEDYTARNAAAEAEIIAVERLQYGSAEEQERIASTTKAVLRFASWAPNEFRAAIANQDHDARRRIVTSLSHNRIQTGRNLLLERHPYLNELAEHLPEIRHIQTVKSGSGKAKETSAKAEVSFGSPVGKYFKPLNLVVEAICVLIRDLGLPFDFLPVSVAHVPATARTGRRDA